MLTNKDYKAFFETYVLPDVLENIIAKMGMEGFAEVFVGDKAEGLLEAFMVAKEVSRSCDLLVFCNFTRKIVNY